MTSASSPGECSFLSAGRLGKDQMGNFTCRNASVVYYCLSNVNVLERLFDLEILEFSTFFFRMSIHHHLRKNIPIVKMLMLASSQMNLLQKRLKNGNKKNLIFFKIILILIN
jgi:hypothetical protein